MRIRFTCLPLVVALWMAWPACLLAAPPNDDFSAATIVTGFPAMAAGSNVDATVEEGEPLLGDWYEYSVWYRWTAPTSGAVRIDTLEGGRDTILVVWTNAVLTNLALVAQNDGYDETEMSAVFFDAVSGTTYQIAVYGYDYDLGDLALRITNDALPRISGRVTGPGGAPALAGIEVQVRRWDEEYEGWNWVNTGTSDATGNFVVRGIPAGTYRAEFNDEAGDYLTEAFDDAADLDSGTDVVVAAANVTGIDAELAVASKIAGTVTGPDGSPPLAGIEVTAYRWNESGGYWGSVTWGNSTDAAGAYAVGGLVAGTYRIGFSDSRNGYYLNEAYSNAADVASGVDIVVAAATTVTGVNASLAVASKIAGTVTGPDGSTPLEDIQVTAYRWSESGEYWESATWGVNTDAAGAYRIGGLPAGTYRVEFRDWQNGDFLTEVYSNAVDVDAGTDVGVGAGETAGGIDASLGVASKISGTVTGPDGTAPLVGFQVSVFEWNGSRWGQGNSGNTGSGGTYAIGGLAAGTYRVQFYGGDGTYVTETYDNAADVDSGTDVVVGAETNVTGIDAALALAAHISGTVTGPDGTTGLSDIQASAHRWNGSGWSWVASDRTVADGTYAIGGLTAGTYRVRFDDWGGTYRAETYDDTADLDSGADLVLGAGETLTGIDASLADVNSADLAGIQFSGGGGFEIRFTGTPSLDYILQEAHSLTGGWSDVGTSTTALSGLNTLPGSSSASQIFWRVRLLP